MRRAVWVLVFLGLALALEVRQADRLFLSEDQTRVVLEGTPVVLVYKGRTIEARRVVYDRKRRRLILEGGVRYTDAEGRTIEAEYLVLDLESEDLDALEVHLRQGKLDFFAPKACRVLGQVKLPEAYFTPCLACGQKTPDYAFFADKVVIYPGDRIVAWGVEVEIEGKRVLRLPLLLLYTNPRRPRLSFGLDETDGIVVAADLPYVGLGGAGFTLLRYFERRGWGLGFDHWGAGPARAHYQALYLPPPVGGERGTWSLGVDYQLDEGGFRRSLKLHRDDAKVRGRFGLRAEVARLGKAEPYARFTLDLDLDTDPGAPAPTRRFLHPEVELRYPKGYRSRDFSINGRAVLGGYSARTNPLNRSARLVGPRITAGRVLIEHHERYHPRLPQGLRFSLQNDFTGYYYDTGERQIAWKSALVLAYGVRPFTFGINVTRQVEEGETPFAFDHRPTRRRAEARPYVELKAGGFRLKAESGWAFFKQEPLPLGLLAVYRDRLLSARLSYQRSLEEGEPLRLDAALSLTPRPYSFSLKGGYDYQEARYEPLSLAAGYAFVGGRARLSSSYDPEAGDFRQTSFSLAWVQGRQNASLRLGYRHQRPRLNGEVALGEGRFSLKGGFSYAWPGERVADGGVLKARVGLGWDQLRLSVDAEAEGGAFRRAEAVLGAREATLSRGYSAELRLHLPDAADPGVFVRQASFKGGVELVSWLAAQGRLVYERAGTAERLGFYDFGVTAAFPKRPSTRAYLSLFLNQRFDLHAKTPSPVRPRIVFTYDRCCWGLRFSIDALKEEVRLSWVYGGQAANLVFDEEGVLLPGGVRWP